MQVSSLLTSSTALLNPLKSVSETAVDDLSASSPATEDVVELSPQARKINDTAKAEKSSGIVDMAKNVEVNRRSVEKLINRLLMSHSISNAGEIKFKLDGGRITVDGNHPDKEKIERILNENTELTSSVSELLSDSHTLAATKVQQKYSIALNDDEDDEDKDKQESEFERQLRLHEKAVSFQNQVANVADSFTLSGGTLSVASLELAASFNF